MPLDNVVQPKTLLIKKKHVTICYHTVSTRIENFMKEIIQFADLNIIHQTPQSHEWKSICIISCLLSFIIAL